VTTELHAERLTGVREAVREIGAGSVIDLGCGEGDFLVPLLEAPEIQRIVALDSSGAALARLRERLAERSPAERARVEPVRASVLAPPSRFRGLDAAVLVEVIEHIRPERLSALERGVFRGLGPSRLVVTTPNADFNPLLGVPEHRLREPDHRFEWGRARFARWARGVGARCGYRVSLYDLAGAHPSLGGASQMAVFDRAV